MQDVSTQRLAENTCILMCRLHREGRSWKAEAIGDFLPEGYMGRDDDSFAAVISYIDQRRAQAAA